MKNRIALAVSARQGFRSFYISAVALLAALLCGAVIIAFCGYSPGDTYTAIFKGSLGSWKGIVLSLSQATPLMFTGLAFAIAFRVRLVNLGAEGQLHAGGMASALVGSCITFLPGFAHTGLSLLAGVLAGGLIGMLIGTLKIRFGAQEVITSLIINEILVLFTSYLCNGPFKAPDSVTPQTAPIEATARLSRLVPRSQLTVAILLAALIAVVLYILLKRTSLGYEMQVIGHNLRAAQTAGMAINKIYLFTLFVSGAIAGLCGSTLVLGVYGRFVEGFSANYGFGGISVAALAAYNPIATVFSALIFGVLKAGAMSLNRTTAIPVEFVSVIQALVVVFVAAPRLITGCAALLGKLFRPLSRKGRAEKA